MRCSQCKNEFKSGDHALKYTAGNIGGKDTFGEDYFIENETPEYVQARIIQCIPCGLQMALTLKLGGRRPFGELDQ